MKIDKKLKMFILAEVIFFGVFNAIAFLLPFVRGSNFWMGYSFEVIALIVTALVVIDSFGKPGAKSKFYGLPPLFIVFPFLIVQTIFSFLQMAIPSFPLQYLLIINIVILSLTLIGLIGIVIGKDVVVHLDESRSKSIFYIKSLQSDFEMLSLGTTDESLRKNYTSLAEKIRFSDPMSNSALAEVETKIHELTMKLKSGSYTDAQEAMTTCAQIGNLITERNTKLKNLK